MIPGYIILHTAAYKGDADIEDIRRWHLDRGWNDVGYHYYIRRDGEIQKGREETVSGAHARGMNADSLGICFEGHGDYEAFTQYQRNALCDLYEDILTRWDIPVENVLGHRETGAPKTCPGNKVDMDDIRNMLKIWLDIPDVSPPDNKLETVDPAELDSWEMSMPAEWIEEVDEGKGLQQAKEIAEDALKRSEWKRRGAMALNVVIGVAARLTRIPELNHLKLKTEKPMKRVKPYLKQKSTWEGVAAILGAVGVTIYPGAIVEIVAGVFVIIGGIEMWKKEAEEQ